MLQNSGSKSTKDAHWTFSSKKWPRKQRNKGQNKNINQKGSSKKEKNKNKVVVSDTELTEDSKMIGDSENNDSNKKKSNIKKKKEKNNSNLEKTEPIDINQVSNDNIEKGDVFTVNNILFDFAKSDLKKSSYKELNKVVNLMKENDAVKIELSAHTDNVGSDKYNLSLSKARAKSSRKYLISKGISSKRISSKGYGERKPIATNKTVKGRKQNRRVEIKITSSN